MKPDSLWASAKDAHHRRWGHLTLVDELNVPLILKDNHGNPYVADTESGLVRWKLICDCGHEFVIDKDSFPGRRIARNCNRPECPYTKRREPVERRTAIGRPVTMDGGANHSVYFPRHVGDAVRAYALQRKLSFSAACAELILEGALQKLVNE